MNAAGARFNLTLPIQIRLAGASDLKLLEWGGTFTAHREIIHEAFAAQERGEGAMLVADCNGFPVGQVWIDFCKEAAHGAGYIWAFRVLSWMQRVGLGTHLIKAAEALISEHGFAASALSVDPENADAQRLFQRMGYRAERQRMDEYSYETPEGQRIDVRKERIIFQKNLCVPGGVA